jgi:hypothetical protein
VEAAPSVMSDAVESCVHGGSQHRDGDAVGNTPAPHRTPAVEPHRLRHHGRRLSPGTATQGLSALSRFRQRRCAACSARPTTRLAPQGPDFGQVHTASPPATRASGGWSSGVGGNVASWWAVAPTTGPPPLTASRPDRSRLWRPVRRRGWLRGRRRRVRTVVPRR